jgi:hypothetical protein
VIRAFTFVLTVPTRTCADVSLFTLNGLVGEDSPTPKLVPSNTNAVPLVATFDPFKYNTPLAVPPERVRLPVKVAVAALTEAIEAFVTVSPVITAVPTLADATLAPVAVRVVTVPVVISATPTLAEAIDALVAVRLLITATPALMEAIEAAVN